MFLVLFKVRSVRSKHNKKIICVHAIYTKIMFNDYFRCHEFLSHIIQTNEKIQIYRKMDGFLKFLEKTDEFQRRKKDNDFVKAFWSRNALIFTYVHLPSESHHSQK